MLSINILQVIDNARRYDKIIKTERLHEIWKMFLYIRL